MCLILPAVEQSPRTCPHPRTHLEECPTLVHPQAQAYLLVLSWGPALVQATLLGQCTA